MGGTEQVPKLENTSSPSITLDGSIQKHPFLDGGAPSHSAEKKCPLTTPLLRI